MSEVSPARERLRARIADLGFAAMRVQNSLRGTLGYPVISTARPFSVYRTIFFEGRAEHEVLRELAGQRVVDIGCGLTPYAGDSMFQACHSAGIDFYGVDPKIGEGFRLGALDRAKAAMTGSRSRLDRAAPGLHKAIAAPADRLPFDDGSVDLILSSWLLFVWLHDPDVLAASFAEFRRVLRPGGRAVVYPHTQWRADRARREHAGLADVLAGFDISQRFLVTRRPGFKTPPAYVTTFARRP